MNYIAGWNMPGYLPECELEEFDDLEEALDYIRDELLRVIDSEPLQDGQTPTERKAREAIAEISDLAAGELFESGNVGGYIYWVAEGES